MRYALVDTAIGTFGIAWTDNGVARVALPGRDRIHTEMWISRDPAEPGFPDGALGDLGEAARVQALCLAGDSAGAVAVAARLVAAYPGSAVAQRHREFLICPG